MPEYTYEPGLALDAVTLEPAANATGVLTATSGGDPLETFDLNDLATPVTTNKKGYYSGFKADVPVALLSFGEVALPVVSVEARDSGLEAQAAQSAAEAAASSAATAVMTAQTAATDAEAAVAAAQAPADAAVDAGINRAEAAGRLLTPAAASSTYASLSEVAALEATLPSTYARVDERPPTPQQYREPGDVDFTAAFGRLVSSGKTRAYIPPSATPLDVTAKVTLPATMTLEMDGSIRATAPIVGALIETDVNAVIRDQAIVGRGTVDANAMADFGVHLRNFVRYRVQGVAISGAKVAGVKLGDSAAPRAAEALLHGLHILTPETSAVPAGSSGVLTENSGDHSLAQIIVNGFETGVKLAANSSHTVSEDVHVWTNPSSGSTSVGFDDAGTGNLWMGCYADTPSVYGFRLRNFSARLFGCKVGMASNYGVDNVVIGVKMDQADPYVTLIGCSLTGSAPYRLAKDIDVANLATVADIAPGTADNVVTSVRTGTRVIALTARDDITSGRMFRADAATPSANLGLAIRTNGKDRWRLTSDGGPETGVNAGSGLRLGRHDDAGALLQEVLWIARASGTLLYRGSAIFESSLQHRGTTFGAFNTTPVAKQTVTGSRGGNAALASLLTAMANLGWITDSSTA